MFDTSNDSQDRIDTRVNFWPSLVDAISCVLILMFLLYLAKSTPSRELEAARARKAMTALCDLIKGRFEEAGFSNNTVTCQYTTNILRISFSNEILFQSGKYQILAPGETALQISAQVLTSPSTPQFDQLQVEGYTDPVWHRPTRVYPRDNWELSSARAIAVLKRLIELGVHPKIASANGYADQMKVDLGTGEQANRKNRRIELRIDYSVPTQSETRQPSPIEYSAPTRSEAGRP